MIIQKSFLAFVLFVSGFVSLKAEAQTRLPPCNPAVNPHSFSCQQDSFLGKIFPLVPATKPRLAGNWRTLVYTPSPRQPALFRSRVSPKNPRIPTGILNPDNSVVGNLIWPSNGQILFAHFGRANNHMTQASQVALGDANTAQVGFKNPADPGRHLLMCRIFVRNRNEHMLCQWMRDRGNGFEMLGYFGFVR